MRILPDWIESYLSFTSNTEPSYLYRLFSGIFAISAALQRKCWLQWHTQIYPNFYIALSGPSSSRKNTALDPVYAMLKDIDVPLSPMASRRGLSKVMAEAKRDAITKSNEIIVHSSLALIAKELAVLFSHDAQDMIRNLVNWYDCDDTFDYLTASQGQDSITGVCLTLAGGITPELIQSTMPKEAVGGGLFSRFLFIYAETKGKLVPIPFLSKQDMDLRARLTQDLNEIKMMVGRFDFTEDFIEKYALWYAEHDRSRLFRNTVLSAYAGRKQVHLLKLCMVSSASRSDDFLITVKDFNRAKAWLLLAEKDMLKPFQGFGRNELAQYTAAIIAAIEYDGQTTLHDLLAEFYNDLSKEDIAKALYALQGMGKVKLEMVKGGNIIVRKVRQDDQNEDEETREI